MSETVIKVENLSKQYRLGSVGTGSLMHDINRSWHRVRGKEDPYLTIGETNDRTQKGTSEYVWALKDINFEVQHGEVLGIIGRNGAGKSTLLKILSRTTTPTTGIVKLKGKVASLLEVGTGFHPELSGRENIYLNGAILGMSKQEIKNKFDEIVDFAGVERYIDTPVKRYSSGMYVRLAFGVAAYLEPEILIVDEVLAVGDAEFQKKALGKMKDVSRNEGRTVLFVSHNMSAIQKLCTQGIFLKNGSICYAGGIEETISEYLGNEINSPGYAKIETDTLNALQTENGYAEYINLEDIHGNQMERITIGKFWQLRIRFRINKPLEHFIIGIGITSQTQAPVFTSWSIAQQIEPGVYEALFKNDQILLSGGTYTLAVGLSNYEKTIQFLEEALLLEVSEIKDESVINNKQLVRTSGSGLILNPIGVTIYPVHDDKLIHV